MVPWLDHGIDGLHDGTVSLCRWQYVGLNVGIEKVESHITRSRIERFLEILWDYTQEGSQKMTLVKIGTGSRIPPPKGPFRISFWGHISAPNQDACTKFGGIVGNELQQFGRRRQCTTYTTLTGGKF